jgi:hypothetical protein
MSVTVRRAGTACWVGEGVCEYAGGGRAGHVRRVSSWRHHHTAPGQRAGAQHRSRTQCPLRRMPIYPTYPRQGRATAAVVQQRGVVMMRRRLL